MCVWIKYFESYLSKAQKILQIDTMQFCKGFDTESDCDLEFIVQHLSRSMFNLSQDYDEWLPENPTLTKE